MMCADLSSASGACGSRAGGWARELESPALRYPIRLERIAGKSPWQTQECGGRKTAPRNDIPDRELGAWARSRHDSEEAAPRLGDANPRIEVEVNSSDLFKSVVTQQSHTWRATRQYCEDLR
jgi:hypothetical protein